MSLPFCLIRQDAFLHNPIKMLSLPDEKKCALRVRGLEKSFDGEPILQGIDPALYPIKLKYARDKPFFQTSCPEAKPGNGPYGKPIGAVSCRKEKHEEAIRNLEKESSGTLPFAPGLRTFGDRPSRRRSPLGSPPPSPKPWASRRIWRSFRHL